MGKRKESSIWSLWYSLTAVLVLFGGLAFGKVTVEAEDSKVPGITYTVDGDTVTVTGTGERSDSAANSIINWNSDSLQGVTHVKFENCKISGSLSCAFFWISRSISIDLSGLDTSSVTDMSAMVNYCGGLTSLDLSGLDTGSVTNMSAMFNYCWGLTSLDLSGWDTSSVTDMGYLFNYCSGLTSLDVSSFDLSKVCSADDMFSDCNFSELHTPKALWEGASIELPGTYVTADGRETNALTSDFLSLVLSRKEEPAQPVYRLYNPNSGEHLYTTDANETKVLATSGWNYEGIGWFAPQTGAAVYRLYSPVTTVHLYTSDQNEVNILVAGGAWQMDNDGKPMFYTGDAGTPGQVPIYRLYNEQERMHLLTTDLNEYDILGGMGWNREGEKLSCLSLGDPAAPLP